ncbi:hypothetical protein EGR_02709 [Echinococcus granulosus]|uniref:Uncharacterized protein n=1 Tax=Echinococcus granulosus TaxID=6210 RepID=W6UVX8_ECHGR|nr:hypothetical protein EGR_02709 [Echinococcus granulosus]EUB62577.1 hypothetical protein EGR_02709 [Echinococcus granulosus]
MGSVFLASTSAFIPMKGADELDKGTLYWGRRRPNRQEAHIKSPLWPPKG